MKIFFKKYTQYILYTFVLIGFSDTLYLLYNEWFNQGECQVFSGNCGKVLNSPYSHILTIPLSLWGSIYYLTLIIFTYLSFRKNKNYFLPLFILSLLGSGFSFYLFYLQAVVIQAWCPLCLISFTTSNVIFLLLFILHWIYPLEERAQFDSKIIYRSLAIFFWNLFAILFFFQITNGYLQTLTPMIDEQEISFVGIIDDDYIKNKDLNSTLNEYFPLEHQKIKTIKIKTVEFLLLIKEAKQNNKTLQEYLIGENIISNDKEYPSFLNNFHEKPSSSTKILIEKLKGKYFFRNMLE